MTTKNTMFYLESLRRFPVPLLAIEHYSTASAEIEQDEEYIEVLHNVLTTVCGVLEPEAADYEYLISRLQEVSKIQDEVNDTKPSASKSFGTSFMAYMNTLDTVEMLGLMTNYNMSVMRELYCKVDFSHTRELMKSFTQMLMEKNVVMFEAALYGAGNSYKGDDPANKVIDANSKEGMAMMKQYGVGDVSSDMLEQLGINLDVTGPAPQP